RAPAATRGVEREGREHDREETEQEPGGEEQEARERTQDAEGGQGGAEPRVEDAERAEESAHHRETGSLHVVSCPPEGPHARTCRPFPGGEACPSPCFPRAARGGGW